VLLNALGTSTPQDYTVYGRIPGPQTSVAPGAYSDSLVVTLTYF
jgi:spore coat protein U-like protein